MYMTLMFDVFMCKPLPSPAKERSTTTTTTTTPHLLLSVFLITKNIYPFMYRNSKIIPLPPIFVITHGRLMDTALKKKQRKRKSTGRIVFFFLRWYN